ncbi:MAG: gamma-glutamyltransferase [Alphaproteobacteria bacterium]|nr:gamma-glutamyltransferase [Alphaproteobacteria bacterium]
MAFVRVRHVLHLSVLLLAVPALADGPVRPHGLLHPAAGKAGMVVAQEAQAARIGVDVLQRGGNAVDAAVAMGFALAVTLPRAGNLGGGGFMMVHAAETGRTAAIDYRETAPRGATQDMFLGAGGKVDKERERYSHKAVAVPGTVAGLALALRQYGSMPLKALIAPAVRLAEDGFVVSQDMAKALARHEERLARWPASAKIFLRPDGQPLRAGDRLVQADLAASLRLIGEQGPDAFYRGAIAERIVAEMKSGGGLIAAGDLAGYRAIVRQPVTGTYRGYEIRSMPPPSSGGIHVIQILNILEGYDLAALGPNSAASIHLLAEAAKRAYADRSRHLGDPDFWKVPSAGLTSKNYAAALRKSIDLARATPSDEIAPGEPARFEGPNTTHFTVADAEGNVVANTYTLNLSYGSGIVAAGTGILLNNEMADFVAKPGVPNAFGLLGDDANAVAAGKRPLSSMSPTIVLKDGKLFLATGSPGGSRIITTVVQILLNAIDHRMNIADATAAPRVHHQWQPDTLRVEQGISPDTRRLLEAMGHRVEIGPPMGATQSIMQSGGRLFGASDPRSPDGRAIGY